MINANNNYNKYMNYILLLKLPRQKFMRAVEIFDFVKQAFEILLQLILCTIGTNFELFTSACVGKNVWFLQKTFFSDFC